jgi:cytochrome P450
MEARIALGAFLKRFPNYGLADKPTRSRRARFRGFTAMPVSLR